MRKAVTSSLFIGVVLAVILVLSRGWKHGFTASNILFLATSGLVLGAIAAPVLEPRAFRYPALWQMAFATIGCLLLAVAWDATTEGYLLAIVGGAVLGYVAPIWVKFINP